ncbi:ring canal kelch protein-like [Anneissia japonica]|uniref:ring canal kelch protein-like n=1 Tax=Anneissia japonica TaxID=1529436 RepID=UPI0014257548|nr:ring canal kelch protein-like [Anneissia japonica]
MESIGTCSLENTVLPSERGITICVDETDFNVSRSELALLGPNFENHFSITTQGCIRLVDIIKSPEVNARGFKLWLQEIRQPMSVAIGKDNALDLMSVANFANQQIIQRCMGYVDEATCRNESLDVDHCGDIYTIAIKGNMTNIINEIEKRLCQDFVKFLSCQQFQAAVGADKLIQMLQTKGLAYPSEVDLLQTILNWIRYDIKSRGCVAGDVLAHVKLSQIAAEDLKRTMYKPDLMEVPHLREAYINEMHRYAIQPALAMDIPQQRRVLVTFKCKKPMYYNHKKNKWLHLPGLNVPGKITTCAVARDSIYAIVKRSQLWKYSTARNKWKNIETPIEVTTKEDSYDDLVFLNGKLYIMSNHKMWSKTISPPGNWNKCRDNFYCCFRSSSVAMGRYILRIGNSRNKDNTWCNCYDTFADEYVLRRLLLWQPMVLMNRHGFSVLTNFGIAVYDWYKWAQNCIKHDNAMKERPDKNNIDSKFEISQDLVAAEHRINIIIIKGHVYRVVGHMLFGGMREDEAAGVKNYDIATISEDVDISPGEKITCVVNLSEECFR